MSKDPFHPVHDIEQKAYNIFTRGPERLTKIQATSRPDYSWPEFRSVRRKQVNKKKKKHWASQKPKLENARKLSGICYIDPDDMEFQDTMKNVREKFELPLQSAMPCKVQNLGHGEIRFADNSNTCRS